MKLVILRLVCLGMLWVLPMGYSSAGTVTISEVYYNPNGSEFSLEFIELYNPGNLSENIGGWWLNTSASERDAVIPKGSTIPAKGYFLVADQGFGEAKPASWPEADYEEDITLVNSGGYVMLVSGSGVESEVDWENKGEEGESYTRMLQAGGYNTSFYYTKPSPKSTYGQSDGQAHEQAIEIQLNVEDAPPRILQFSIKDENPNEEGIQLFPNLGKRRLIAVNLTIEGNASSTVLSLDGNGLGNSTILEIPYSMRPGNHTLGLVVCGSGGCSSANLQFEVQPVLGFELDTVSLSIGTHKGGYYLIEGDRNLSTPRKPTVRNSGNIPLMLEVSTTGLKLNQSSIPPNYIGFRTIPGSPFHELSMPQTLPLDVLATRAISFRFEVPGSIHPGVYAGKLVFKALQ